MFVGVIMNNDKNTINILKTSIAVFSLLSIFNFIGIAGSSYGLYNKTAYSKKFFILKTTTKKYCKSESCDFDYTGDEQMFVAPKTGTYKLETWGAQGGSANKMYYGGYGGYSVGKIKLTNKDKVYVNIGESPKQEYNNYSEVHNKCNGNEICYLNMTYNGGGFGFLWNTPSNNILFSVSQSGGGATHISDISGQLFTLENKRNSIIIVSGGGGAGDYYYTFKNDSYYHYGIGGNAGGYIGNNGTSGGNNQSYSYYGTGGTQTSGGKCNNSDCCNESGFFGHGSPSTMSYIKNSYKEVTGGGGGYYGGGVGRRAGGGGGSGYIGNTSLTDKHMACYNCETSNEESTKTISVTCASETPTSDCAKIGNGYAKITYLGN